MEPVAATASPVVENDRERPIVFFDGDCGFCHRSVRFLVDRDPAGALRFARLQGELAHRLLSPAERDAGRDGSVVLLEPGMQVSLRSEAVLRSLGHLPSPWSWIGSLARVRFLRPLLDVAYRLVARHRTTWLGGPAACELPDARVRARLLD
ncbi:MAG TPA: DCC1-like thiol-disulfide oxidoreductase family protein [Candidatus Binatia bacterium]|nr:DCC1-like thiol-disulfide oxidoreductase family protein [Candidatus Binatia bacterium]